MLTDSENLTHKVIAWATDIAGYAARLPSKQARDGYLRERHRELVAGAQADWAGRLSHCEAGIAREELERTT